MISNNATVKLKLKTCHELDSEKEIAAKGPVREGPEGDGRRAPFGSRDCYNSRTVVSHKDRDKIDYRPANRNKYGYDRSIKGNWHRSGNGKSKGSFSSDNRKNNTGSHDKYNASIDGLKSNAGKPYESSADSGAKFRSDTGSSLGSDDSKISKVLRRLAREDDPEKFIALAKQLQVNANI